MSRIFINDATKTDVRAKLTAEKIASIADIICTKPQYIEWVSNGSIKILAGTVISVNTAIFKVADDITITCSTALDTGVFTYGKDYYIYLCDAADNSSDEIFKISLNSSYPDGYTAVTSRKIGGFHYGYIRCCNAAMIPVNPAGTEWGTDWKTNVELGIVPRSLWTIKHRPKCTPEGMVYITSGLWVDIYTASDDGVGGLQSKQGVLPISGAEGQNWYTATNKGSVVNKRLLRYNEWILAAFGSPSGENNNTYAWTSATNSNRTTTGSITYATSVYGIRDAVGNLWEFTNDLTHKPNASITWAEYDVFTTDYNTGFGKANMPNSTAMVAFICGGMWAATTYSGSRETNMDWNPWNVGTALATRLCCESL